MIVIGGGSTSGGSGTSGNGWKWNSGGGSGTGGGPGGNNVNGFIANVNNFKNDYGIDLLDEKFENLTLECKSEGGDFESCCFGKIAAYYDNNLDESNFNSDLSGFFDRTLACNSFNFTTVGACQIACVSGLYLSKYYVVPGIYANTSPFCISFTVPKTKFNGQNISSGKAADCAAWSSNAAAAICGFAFSENPLMTDQALILLFKTTWALKMKVTDCGYGAVASCNSQNCPGGQNNAVWNSGFFNWLDDQLFGCE